MIVRFTITHLLMASLLIATLVAWGQVRRRAASLAEQIKLESQQLAVAKASLAALDHEYIDVLNKQAQTLRSLEAQLREYFNKSHQQESSIEPVAHALVSIRDVPVLREAEDINDPITTRIWTSDREPVYLNFCVSHPDNDSVSLSLPTTDQIGPSKMVSPSGPYAMKVEPGPHELKWKFAKSTGGTLLISVIWDEKKLLEINSIHSFDKLSNGHARPSAVKQFDFKDLRHEASLLAYVFRLAIPNGLGQLDESRIETLHFWLSTGQHDWPNFPQPAGDPR